MAATPKTGHPNLGLGAGVQASTGVHGCPGSGRRGLGPSLGKFKPHWAETKGGLAGEGRNSAVSQSVWVPIPDPPLTSCVTSVSTSPNRAKYGTYWRAVFITILHGDGRPEECPMTLGGRTLPDISARQGFPTPVQPEHPYLSFRTDLPRVRVPVLSSHRPCVHPN